MLLALFLLSTSLPTTARSSDAVVIAAGDVADCRKYPATSNGAALSANLVDRLSGTVLALGDLAYDRGTADEFRLCYGPSWGRFKARTRPSPGNHEFQSAGAAPYFAYFGSDAGPSGKGYYSFDVGSWHILSPNSEMFANMQTRQPGGDASSGDKPDLAPLWQVLYAAGVDVVLTGHHHLYARYAPQNPEGAADPEHGMRQFIVGTGGAEPSKIGRRSSIVEALNNITIGVLKLNLQENGYRWEYIPAGRFSPEGMPLPDGDLLHDSGTGVCH